MSPDRRKHRGPHPEDRELFSGFQREALRTAVGELSWLLSRGYAPRSSLSLVGDRHNLRERQRIAVGRSACSDKHLRHRSESCAAPDLVRGREVVVDGLNVIVSIEAAVSGGAILKCRDGAYRDLASVHGSYRKVEETRHALELIGDALVEIAPAEVHWLLDRPVSNSGRLAALIEAEARRRGADWLVELVQDPDPIMKSSGRTVATSDSAILDECMAWLGLTRIVVDNYIPDAWIIDLRPVSPSVN